MTLSLFLSDLVKKDKRMHEIERNCSDCGKRLSYDGYKLTNIREHDIRTLMDLWQNKLKFRGIKIDVQIKCCECTKSETHNYYNSEGEMDFDDLFEESFW